MEITNDENEYLEFELKKRTRVLLLNKVNEEIHQLFPQGSNDEREKKFYKSVMSEFLLNNNEIEQNPQIDNYHAKKLIKETFLNSNSKNVLALLEIILKYLSEEFKVKNRDYNIYKDYDNFFQQENVNCSFQKNQMSLIEDKINIYKDRELTNPVKKFFNDWGSISAIAVVFLTILSGMNKLTIMNHFNISYKFLSFNFTELFTLLVLLSIIILLIIIIPIVCFNYEKKNFVKGLKKDYILFKAMIYIFSCILINVYLFNTALKTIKFNIGVDVNYTIFFIIVCIGLWPIFFEQNKIYDKNYLKNSKFKVIRFVFILPKLIITLFLYMILLEMFINQVLGNDINYITKYDQIIYNEEPYVILILMDGKAIIAEFDDCNIYTDSYLIIDITDKVITSKVFEKPPKILPE